MKASISRLLPTSRFARSVSVLVGGTAASQLLGIAASPVLTRLYTPEDFGLLAVYVALLSTLAVIANLRYQLAIPLPESDQEAASVTVLSLLVAVGMTIFVAAALWQWGAALVRLLNTPRLIPYLWLLPLGLLLAGIYQVFNYWAVRTHQFPVIARTRLSQAVTQLLIQIPGYAVGPLALLIGQAAGHGAGIVTLFRHGVRKHWSAFRSVDHTGLWRALCRWRRFPLFSTWEGMANAVGVQLPPLLFAALFSPAAAGIYLLAHRVLQLPMTLVGQAVAQVFFAQAAGVQRKGELAPLVAGIHAHLVHFAMPPAFVLILTGPDLFAFVFGEGWRQAGQFAQWMAPWLYLVFVTSPLSQLFSVLEKQSQGMLFQFILLVVRASGLVGGALTGDLLHAVALFSVGSAVCWFGFLIWIIRTSGNSYAIMFRPTLVALLLSFFFVIPILLYRYLGAGTVQWFVALVISGLLIFSYCFFRLRRVW